MKFSLPPLTSLRKGKTDWPTFGRGIITGGALLLVLQQGYAMSPLFPDSRRIGQDVRYMIEAMDSPEGVERVSRAVELFAETSALVDQVHLEHPLDNETLSRMIDGALGKLDPYSGFISEDLAMDLTSEGDPDHRRQIGFIVSPHDGAYRIEAVAPGSPAENAGIQAGDEVVRVDGRYVGNETAYTVNEILRDAIGGEGGDRIDLGIRRPGVETILNVVVHPADIDPLTVFDLGVRDGILHLYLKGFYPGLAADTDELISRAIQQEGIRGVVLDLRNNGGGLTDEALALAELFLPQDSLLYELSGRAVGVEQVRTTAVPRYPNLGVSVIVNGNTASSSEIIAGAFQAHDRATIVGWRTLGKGTVQRVFPIDTGAITITFAQYRDGGLRKIQGIGVMPNIALDAPDPRMRPSRFDRDAARDAAIEAAAAAARPGAAKGGFDGTQ